MSISEAADLQISLATTQDLVLVHELIERCYRGESAREGWTHEADLLFDARTDIAALEGIIADPQSHLLVARLKGLPVGCVQISNRGNARSYLGLLCIRPDLQAGGLGRQLIAEAETQAHTLFNAHVMTMSVIEQRKELIAYYMRRGYAPTGRRLDFVIPLDPPLFMTELAKALA